MGTCLNEKALLFDSLQYKLVEPIDLSKVEIPKKFLQRNDMSLDTYAKK